MKLVILSEAGLKKGMGHFVRMSSVAEYCLKQGFQVTMYMDTDGQINNFVDREYVEYSAWTNNEQFLDMIHDDDVVMVDSYTVDLEFLESCKEKCGRLIVIDDNSRLNYTGMTILNPNYFAESMEYQSGQGNTYLLGKYYTLLRSEFYSPFTRTVKETVTDVLITMGGTDVMELTDKFIIALHELDANIKLHVVVTDAFANLKQIKDVLGKNDVLYIGINAQEMRDLMVTVDFAIASAGQTSNELIKTQCPTALSIVADNQILNAQYLARKGFAILLPDGKTTGIERMFSSETRLELAANLQSYETDRRAATYIAELLKGNVND